MKYFCDSSLRYSSQCPSWRANVTVAQGVRLIHFEITSDTTEAVRAFFDGLSAEDQKDVKKLHSELADVVKQLGTAKSEIDKNKTDIGNSI